MRLLHISWLVLASGCGSCAERPPAASSASSAVNLGLAGEPGCRFEAVVVAGLPNGFDCTKLTQSGVEGRQLGVSGGLRGFCQARLTAPAGTFEAASAKLAARLPEGASLSPDCVVVQPFGDGSGTSSAARAEFDDRQAGFPVGPAPIPRSAVEVVVVDDVPRGGAEVFSRHPDRHGAKVGEVLRRLACSAGVCAFAIRSEAALTRMDPRGSGGHARGSLSELAEAIDRAVHASAQPQQLVLNLSAGWDPEAAPMFTDPARGRVAALDLVLRSIRVATCRGAQLVAALGPRPQGLGEVTRTPTYPAAWSTLTKPEDDICGGLWPGSPLGQDARPLVLAVDAVGPYQDAEGRDATPLATARAEATPTLHAYGAFGPQRAGEPRFVGSSAAAAVVSGSLAWMMVYAEPGSPDPVQWVRDLVRSGARLSASVDVPLAAAPTASRARLIRPCVAVIESCSLERCPQCPEEFERSAAPLASERKKAPAVKGRVCPNDAKVTVFGPERDLSEVCTPYPRDVLRRPFARPSGTRPYCRRCVFRAKPGAKVVQVDVELAPGAPSPSLLLFSTSRQTAAHPLESGRGDLHVDIELPGPVPRSLEGVVVFEEGAGSVEPLLRVD